MILSLIWWNSIFRDKASGFMIMKSFKMRDRRFITRYYLFKYWIDVREEWLPSFERNPVIIVVDLLILTKTTSQSQNVLLNLTLNGDFSGEWDKINNFQKTQVSLRSFLKIFLVGWKKWMLGEILCLMDVLRWLKWQL